MKKLMGLLLAVALLLAGCDKKSESGGASGGGAAAGRSVPQHGNVALPGADEDVVVITEKLFIAQTNDIYLNPQDYLGKTIRYEGMYKNSADWDNGLDEILHFVVRYGPGCCGYDDEAGFEVRWYGRYPKVDDWVEVIGTLQEQEYASGMKVLYVEVDDMIIKEERGAEYVST